jgi:hypothetical protein
MLRTRAKCCSTTGRADLLADVGAVKVGAAQPLKLGDHFGLHRHQLRRRL